MGANHAAAGGQSAIALGYVHVLMCTIGMESVLMKLYKAEGRVRAYHLHQLLSGKRKDAPALQRGSHMGGYM